MKYNINDKVYFKYGSEFWVGVIERIHTYISQEGEGSNYHIIFNKNCGSINLQEEDIFNSLHSLVLDEKNKLYLRYIEDRSHLDILCKNLEKSEDYDK